MSRPERDARGDDDGRLTRRALLTAFSALVVASPRLRGQVHRPNLPTEPIVATRTLNHVALRVANVKRSLEFYQRVFGMPVQGYQQNGAVTLLTIGTGPQFLSLVEGTNPHLTHFALGVENFDAERLSTRLAEKGINAHVVLRRAAEQQPPGPGDTPELMVTDSEGVELTLVDVSSCGGTGLLGNACTAIPPASPRAVGPPPIPVRTLNHVAVSALDVSRSVRFYLDTLGLLLQGTQPFLNPPFVPLLGVGRGPSFVAVTTERSQTAGVINHVCFGVEYTGHSAADDVERHIRMLAAHGVAATEERPDVAYPYNVSQGVMFRDPDGLLVQLVDVRYCGGRGELGNVCY